MPSANGAEPTGKDALDLTLLTSGATQHVFVRTDRTEPVWVYKTPAFVDEVLPSPITWRAALDRFGRTRSFVAVLERLTSERWTRTKKHLRDAPSPNGIRAGEFVLRRAERVACWAETGANALWALRARRARRRQFRRMCEILRRLDGSEAAAVMLPARIVEQSCTLRVGERAFRYTGALLQQRRADHFFEYFADFDRFRWDDLVAAQQCLWRHGVALADTDEVLGPRNWALLDGRLLLADTGSLTEDLDHASQIVNSQHLDAREQQIPVWWPEQTGAALGEYCAYVRREINESRLRQLWRIEHV